MTELPVRDSQRLNQPHTLVPPTAQRVPHGDQRAHRAAAPEAEPGETGMLASMGISASAELTYGLILKADGMPRSELGGRDTDLMELLEAGLVHVDGPLVVPIPTRLAVERWVAEQTLRIQCARVGADQFSALHDSTSGGFLEVVRGVEQTRRVARQLLSSATEEVLSFDRDPYFNQSRGKIFPEQVTGVDRGVKYKVIYQQSVLEDPDILACVHQSVKLGEEARTFPNVPMRMMIADGQRALLILPYGTGESGDEPLDLDGVLIEQSTMLDATIRMFEALWAMSVPVRITDCPGRDEDRRLLHLLSMGLTDASIARALGVSERTVHRRIGRLGELLGASTRFLLGVQAAKKGWL